MKAAFDSWEKTAWLPPPIETIDRWAERVIRLPRIVSASPGPLSLDLVPYLRGPLQAASDREVREITLCCSTQVGKTLLLILIALHTLAEDPWNVMHVMSTEDDAEDLSIERYEPIIRASPELAKYLSGEKHQTTRDAIRMNGAVLTFRGAYSPAGLASRPVAKLFLDEVDKWPEWSGKESDPIRLAMERTATFWGSLVVDCSTPTTATRYIWPRLLASTNERYHIPCPECGAFQELVMGGREKGPGIKWPDGVTADVIERDSLAWYECGHCGGRIEERHKPAMLRAGVWCQAAQKVLNDGTVRGESLPRRHVGYHLWAAYSPWRSFSRIAAEFLRSKSSQSGLMNFRNSWQALPWELVVGEIKEDRIRSCVKPYKQGIAPEGAWALTVGVDVQRIGAQVYQYFVIRAWGKEGESWLLRAGSTPDWDSLQRALFMSAYKRQDGNTLPMPSIVLVDSGFETDQVYQFCEKFGCHASKGDVRIEKDFVRGETETIKGSGHWLRRVNFNGDRFKGHLHNLIRADRWHIPEDVPEEYFSHMVAEQQVRTTHKRTGRQRYEWKVTAERPNHLFDCEVLALLGAEMLQLQYLTEPPQNLIPQSQNPNVQRSDPWQPTQRIVSRLFT